MIDTIEIKGFKCINHELLRLAPLTVLAGPNSSGKSTVLQAILLGASAHAQKNLPQLKEVVKPFSQFREVYNRYHNAQAVEIVVSGEGWATPIHQSFRANVETELQPAQAGQLDYESSLFYLCANRVGPEELAELNRELKIGQNGQYALGYFEQRKDKPVHDQLGRSEAPARTLKAQIAWWLSFIAGYEIGPVVEEVTPLQVKVSFSTPDLEYISPFNTGAGTSYLLKLLVMCLCAKPGDVLLIENPEIHLHPGAQSRVGRLFAFLSSMGVQLVVETHCEHLINRIRFEVYSKKIKENGIIIYYKPDAQSQFIRININSRGHYTNEDGQAIDFPQGFFDSTLAELLGDKLMAYSLVLSDDLYREFHAFKHGWAHDVVVVEKLLQLYKPPILTNVNQLSRAKVEDVSLKSMLASAGFVDQSLTDLCRKTFYKLILNNESSDYPFVNVNGDEIRNNYTLTRKQGEKRTKARSYLQALLADASWVVVHDLHSLENWETTKRFLGELFPSKPLTIHWTKKIPGPQITEIKALCPQWTLPSQEKFMRQFRNLHDRYLIIDGKIEVILTSGIDYLFSDDKECTMIVRKVDDDILQK